MCIPDGYCGFVHTLTERLCPATSGLPRYDALDWVAYEVRTPSGLMFNKAVDLDVAQGHVRRGTARDLVITAHHLAPDFVPAIAGPDALYRDPFIHGCHSSFWVFDPDHAYRNIEQTLAALAGVSPRAWQPPEQAGAFITAAQVQYFEGLNASWFGVRVACERPSDGTYPNSHDGDCQFQDWAWNWRTGLPVNVRQETS